MKDLDFSNIHIAVVGDCMLDIYHYGHIDRISPEAPVPIFQLNNKKPEYRLGGACNTALNLSKLGIQTTLYGFTGDDLASEHISAFLFENRIENRLLSLSKFPTITKSRYFSHNQQVIRIDQEDTSINLYDEKKQSVITNHILGNIVKYDAIILSDYGKGTLYPPILSIILKYCHEDLPIFVDPKLNNWEHYQDAFCITPNWNEFKDAIHVRKLDITDRKEIVKYALRQCDQFNISYILLTLGSMGMFLIDNEGKVKSASSKVKEVYDVSGAGDTVIAVLAAAFCKDYSMEIAMLFATMAAKVVISHLGTYAITNDELKKEVLNSQLKI